MAAKLQCEICGGKLIGKPGGIFECDSCGVEYSTEWAKMKIQEIRGTVTVEGTVEVTGKVQVDGPVKVDSSANKEALLQRGNLALEDKDWKKANKYFDQALNMDAKCAEAYLGLVMAETECCDRETFAEKYTSVESDLRQVTNIVRAKQFASESLLLWFKKLDKMGELADKADHEERERAKKRLKTKREGIFLASRMINSQPCALKVDGSVISFDYNRGVINDGEFIVAIDGGLCLRADGTVYLKNDRYPDVSGWTDLISVSIYNVASYYHSYPSMVAGWKSDGSTIISGGNETIKSWKNIVAFAAGYEYIVGLRKDGTVVADGEDSYGRCNINDWDDIVAIAAGAFHTVGLKADGTVVAVGKNDYKQCDVKTWRNIVAIAANHDITVGLKDDGTVVFAGVINQYNLSIKTDFSNWTNIVALSINKDYVLGLKENGTLISTDDRIAKMVSDWKIFNNYLTIESERTFAF